MKSNTTFLKNKGGLNEKQALFSKKIKPCFKQKTGRTHGATPNELEIATTLQRMEEISELLCLIFLFPRIDFCC